MAAAREIIATCDAAVRRLLRRRREPQAERKAIVTQGYVTDAFMPVPAQAERHVNAAGGHGRAIQQVVWLNGKDGDICGGTGYVHALCNVATKAHHACIADDYRFSTILGNWDIGKQNYMP